MRQRLRTVLIAICAVAAIWTASVLTTGGFTLHIGARRFSSHRADRPAWLLAASVFGVLAASSSEERRRLATTVQNLLTSPLAWPARLPSSLAPVAATTVAVAVVVAGLLRDAPYAAGADAYGYVSQAEMWASGSLHVDEPFARVVAPSLADAVLSPLGYRPSLSRTSMVPMFPPGYPMQMAVFRRLGGRSAVFYVVPLLAGLAVLATYVMGVRLGGRTAGLAAAVLLATCPTFLQQLMFPMSDVPATAWWALGLAIFLFDTRTAMLASGLAMSMAALVRPNLAPLAVVPGLLLLWRVAQERRLSGRALQCALCYATGALPGWIAIAAINQRLYGSASSFGVGPVDQLYALSYAWDNLVRYPSWLMRTQTPVVLLGIAAPLVLWWRRRVAFTRLDATSVALMCVGFMATTYLAYLFYLPKDEWFWLRYLLPAFPALFVLTTVAIVALLSARPRGTRLFVMTVLIAWLAVRGLAFSRDNVVFQFRRGDSRTPTVAAYIASKLPQRSVFLSVYYSGSIRYYANRETVRYDFIDRDGLDAALADFRRLGYHPYFVLDEWEDQIFKDRFRDSSPLGALDWSPLVYLDSPITVKIYDPDDRPTFLGSTTPRDTIHLGDYPTEP